MYDNRNDDEKRIDENENKDVEEVKSRAVVKYSVPKPAAFVRLQCNTDLNMPPANWLSSSADSYGLQRVIPSQKGFSSFRMAQMYPDCVGDVDVVSDAENIKKLLKLPYAKEAISMMVHRIGNSLLIDNFDIYKIFSMKPEESSEWLWLEKFIIEHIGQKAFNADRRIYIQDRTREALKQKSLISKFLYHSLAVNQNELMLENDAHPASTSRSVEYPLLPDPSPDNAVPDSASLDHKYNRNVVWTFEDIEMLLGTDLPIFGEGTYPCISLRLRDMTKPINILTGIDYWLDNLMSNVPEVVMCYHLNGIVQKYELIKTEDIPRLDNSKFSPKVIRDVAQNILSFLKTNATKAGHTYWLFKGKDEEVIKLYDLTCLVPQDEKIPNPFTIPVAMLLYRVALSFMKSKDEPPVRPPGTIRTLLKNCIKLLPEKKYPEIVTSSHYLLSEVYVPFDINPEAPKFEHEKGESVYDDDEDLSSDDPKSAIKCLDLEAIKVGKFFDHYKPPPPVNGSVEERCNLAICHISQGLSCLKHFSEDTKVVPEEEVCMAKPSEPIPMGYSKLDDINGEKEEKNGKKGRKNKDKRKKAGEDINLEEIENKENTLLVKNIQETRSLPTWQQKNIKTNGISWKDHLKILLYEKALLVYATLSEHHYVSDNYGSGLRSIGLLARCSIIMNKLRVTKQLRENCLLGRAGDCCIMMVQYWNNVDAYRNQYQFNNEEDLMMMEQLENDERLYNIHIDDYNVKCVFIYDILTIEQMILKGVECYQEAAKVSETDSILQRLGNSLNEIGMYYLNSSKQCKNTEDLIETAKKAEGYLQKGLENFEKIRDEANIALLNANLGHMHRILGYACAPAERGELSRKEKHHYQKAFSNYKKAMQVLGSRESNPSIWDSVNWELSTASFNMATIMEQNCLTFSCTNGVGKEVLETLQKALTYCDLAENNPKLPLYQYRAATIHYRIAWLYHKHIENITEEASTRRTMICLAKINYNKAITYFFSTQDVLNYLETQLQKLGLFKTLAESSADPNSKIKHLEGSLQIILGMDVMFDLLVAKKLNVFEEDESGSTHRVVENTYFDAAFSFIKLVKQDLQHTLKNLLKLCSAKNPPNKRCPLLAEIYKKSYMISFSLRDELTREDLLLQLNDVLKQLKLILK